MSGNVPNQISKTIGLLHNLQNHLTSSASPISYKGFIRLHLDYWEVIYNELKINIFIKNLNLFSIIRSKLEQEVLEVH